jgi:hypothetical protein
LHFFLDAHGKENMQPKAARERLTPQMTQIAVASFVIIAALVGGVGLASSLVLRHIVQTLPLWISAGLGARRSRAAGWFALPCFVFWLVLMVIIWLYLLDIARLVSGHFTPIEIAMTLVVGAAAVAGIGSAVRAWRTLPVGIAASLFALGAVLQWLCFRVSLLPGIADR